MNSKEPMMPRFSQSTEIGAEPTDSEKEKKPVSYWVIRASILVMIIVAIILVIVYYSEVK
jgi:hypothetical protein